MPTLTRLFIWLAAAVIVALSLAAADSAVAGPAPPQRQLKTYALHNSPNSADISPDEQLVVTESTVKSDGADSGTKTFFETVQVWNFKEDKLIAEFRTQGGDASAYTNAHPKTAFLDLNPARGARFVRFSPDGSKVVALIGHTIYVLRASDLTELRTIPLVAPPSTTQTFREGTAVGKPEVRGMEISPRGSIVALLWVRGLLYGRVQIYDLSSGRILQSWNTPQGWISFTRGIAWDPSGKLLLIAIPNVFPCASPDNEPDIFAFDVRTGAIKKKFTTGLVTGSIGISSDNRVLAVDLNCPGVFKNHHPKLRVFDLATGKRLRAVSGRGTDVRYLVSVSADGNRFLAFTGKVKAKFGWGDFAPHRVVVDETFSVWNLKNYQGIVTSQNIPGLLASGLRLSPNGGYAVSYGKASFVYELP